MDLRKFDEFYERLKERGVDFEMAVEALVDETYPLTPEQLAEVKRRSDAIDAGTAKCIPMEEVMQMIREKRKTTM
jgi:putative addiction module component (TIGR02574 family)